MLMLMCHVLYLPFSLICITYQILYIALINCLAIIIYSSNEFSFCIIIINYNLYGYLNKWANPPFNEQELHHPTGVCVPHHL